jgi:glycosyltransferase involved in cell wall biosynthesis
MPDEPLISCLMVALPVPGRFARLQQSIAGYLGQTHARRELVLVMNGGEAEAAAAIKAHVASLGREDIRIVEPTGELTLGALRNISKASARGEVICQWDDDDLYHPERLERQLAALAQSGGGGVCLRHVMQFFPAARSLYCTNFGPVDVSAFPGSLMCWTPTPIVYPETGDHARLGEDRIVAMQLMAMGRYHVLADAPHLYVYVSHGRNSWDMEHHRKISVELSLSRGLLLRREAALRRDLAPFDFGPGEVTVQGSNGPAFTIG